MQYRKLGVTLAILALYWSVPAASGQDAGLVTKASTFSVEQTIERFEAAVKAKGFVVFTRIDHAAAAQHAGLDMKPRTLIIFGNPKAGTPLMQKSATTGIDLPMKALVWQDDQNKVWLTYNSGEYLTGTVYPRHGLQVPDEARTNTDKLLTEFSDMATK